MIWKIKKKFFDLFLYNSCCYYNLYYLLIVQSNLTPIFWIKKIIWQKKYIYTISCRDYSTLFLNFTWKEYRAGQNQIPMAWGAIAQNEMIEDNMSHFMAKLSKVVVFQVIMCTSIRMVLLLLKVVRNIPLKGQINPERLK